MWLQPSLSALFFTGLLVLTVVVLLVSNWSSFTRLPFDRKICLLTGTGILIGVHGILHYFRFDPLITM